MDQIRVITLGDADSCPGQAKTLTLTPKAASNQVNTTHCVDASVQTETSAARRGYRPVRRRGRLRAGPNPADEDASKTTNQEGVAQHCYSGPETVGSDTIHAYTDNDDGVEDIGTDPSDEATKTWLPAEGNTITPEPKADENPVGTEHCVSATVRDLILNPVAGETVRFVVTGTTTKQGVDQTDGPAWPSSATRARRSDRTSSPPTSTRITTRPGTRTSRSTSPRRSGSLGSPPRSSSTRGCLERAQCAALCHRDSEGRPSRTPSRTWRFGSS